MLDFSLASAILFIKSNCFFLSSVNIFSVSSSLPVSLFILSTNCSCFPYSTVVSVTTFLTLSVASIYCLILSTSPPTKSMPFGATTDIDFSCSLIFLIFLNTSWSISIFIFMPIAFLDISSICLLILSIDFSVSIPACNNIFIISLICFTCLCHKVAHKKIQKKEPIC